MSDHSSDSSAYPAAEPAASNGSTGGALTTVGTTPGLPVAFPGAAMPQRQDVIRGGIDPNSIYHSLRRRWLLAICMGLVAGVAGGMAMFFLFPESSSAIQLFRVATQQQTVISQEFGRNENFETFRQTQMVLIKSPYVLRRALNELNPSSLEFFKDIDGDKYLRHLSYELEVNFLQNSEVLQVSLSGSVDPEELETIVKAISDAYSEEVVFNAKTERLKPREILSESMIKLNAEILRKSEALESILVDESGGWESMDGEPDPESRLLMSEILRLQEQIGEMQERLVNMTMEFERNRRLIQDPELHDQRIDQAIGSMPDVQQMESEMLALKSYIRSLQTQGQRGANNAAIKQYVKQYQAISQELESTRTGLKQQMESEHRLKPSVELRLLTQDFQQQRAVLLQRQQTAQARITEVTELLRERGRSSIDARMRRNEIEGLRQVHESIALKIQQWNVEARADNRISRIPGIETNQGINKTQRYAITGVGGMACFVLTCFGIAYMEFRNRHLNGPEQVDEGLGIRVIGTLPGLSARRALNPRHPVVAQLTESIDSVRTALMHESTSKRRQIVMVTSAATMEGRTTVASQLAASLARAGRRTLLIDGDLRGPALHNLFDLPLEDGLCEVLRAETDVADVIRPTHAEGLWLITAGYCDADAVHALATDQVQPIIEKLRADYDFIIIDAAPVLGLSDSLLFGQHCDGAILSVLRDHTSVPKIHQSAELLTSVGIRLIGAVVNGVVTKADRRVTHLQAVAPKSEQKQLEQAEA